MAAYIYIFPSLTPPSSSSSSSMEYFSEEAMEDNEFYAQLTRQILLIMDEDEEVNGKCDQSSPESEFIGRRWVVGGGSGGGYGSDEYYSSWKGGRSLEVPSWMERLWSGGGKVGTGVFIPPAAVVAAGKSRRRRHNRPRKNKEGGRMSNCSTKIHD